MSKIVDLQGCEHCGNSFPIETMRLMEDCWFCEKCTDDFQNHFDSCDHKWSPYVDQMGDPGQVCERCTGFVRDEDFPLLFGQPAPSQP